MSLLLTINLEAFGQTLQFDQAYSTVTTVQVERDTALAVVITKTKDGSQVLSTKEYRFPHDLDGGNSIEQAYEYLKSLPEFADATDC
jgi:hypothetical protein